MSINIEETLKKDAFRDLDPEMKQAFLRLSKSLEGKSANESIPIIMSFASAMPKGRTIPEEERHLMMEAMLGSMPEADQLKFRNILKMMEGMRKK